MTQERRARYLLALFLFLLVVAPLLSSGTSLLVDWMWFREEGFRVIFSNILKAQIQLSTIAGVGFMAVAALNLLIARVLARRHGYRVYDEVLELPALDRFGSLFRGLIWVGVLLVGYVLGHWGMTHWQEYLLARHAVTMGQADPLFGIDLGFYPLPTALPLVPLSPGARHRDRLPVQRRRSSISSKGASG